MDLAEKNYTREFGRLRRLTSSIDPEIRQISVRTA